MAEPEPGETEPCADRRGPGRASPGPAGRASRVSPAGRALCDPSAPSVHVQRLVGGGAGLPDAGSLETHVLVDPRTPNGNVKQHRDRTKVGQSRGTTRASIRAHREARVRYRHLPRRETWPFVLRLRRTHSDELGSQARCPLAALALCDLAPGVAMRRPRRRARPHVVVTIQGARGEQLYRAAIQRFLADLSVPQPLAKRVDGFTLGAPRTGLEFSERVQEPRSTRPSSGPR